MSVARNSALALVPQVIGIAAAVGTSVVTARYLGASGRGVLSLALMALAVMQVFADGGVSSAITYSISASRTTRNEGLRLCLGGAASLGALGWLAAAALWPLLGDTAFRGVPVSLYAMALAALPAVLFAGFWTRMSMAAGEFVPPVRLQSSVSLGGLVLAVVILPLARLDVFALVTAITMMHWVLAVSLLVAEVRRSGRPKRPDRGTLREVLAFGLRSYPGAIVNWAVLRVDTLVLNAYSTSAAVGRYTMAVALTEKLWLVDSSVGQAALPEVISRDRERAARLVAASNRMVILLTSAAGALLFIAAPWLIDLLYGPEFHAAATVVRILVPGVIASASGRTLLQYHQGHLARPGTVSGVLGTSAFIGVVLYFVLIPRYGLNGAATASSIAYSTVLLIAATLFLREAGLSLRETFVPGRADVESLTTRIASWVGRRQHRD